MIKVKNSELLINVLNSFFHVISTKTSSAHAWLTIRVLLQKLEYEYYFIKNVDVIDISRLKELEYYHTDVNIIKMDSDSINNVNQKKLGQAIQSFADELKKYLGEKAGYCLLKEFRDDLGMEYISIIKDIGVDLRLIELQDELYGSISKNYMIKEDNDSNIAFVKKKL